MRSYDIVQVQWHAVNHAFGAAVSIAASTPSTAVAQSASWSTSNAYDASVRSRDGGLPASREVSNTMRVSPGQGSHGGGRTGA